MLRLAERDKTTVLRCLNVPAADHAAAFLAAAATHTPSGVACTYGENLRTLAVCHAVGISLREARPVELAEVNTQESTP